MMDEKKVSEDEQIVKRWMDSYQRLGLAEEMRRDLPDPDSFWIEASKRVEKRKWVKNHMAMLFWAPHLLTLWVLVALLWLQPFEPIRERLLHIISQIGRSLTSTMEKIVQHLAFWGLPLTLIFLFIAAVFLNQLISHMVARRESLGHKII